MSNITNISSSGIGYPSQESSQPSTSSERKEKIAGMFKGFDFTQSNQESLAVQKVKRLFSCVLPIKEDQKALSALSKMFQDIYVIRKLQSGTFGKVYHVYVEHIGVKKVSQDFVLKLIPTVKLTEALINSSLKITENRIGGEALGPLFKKHSNIIQTEVLITRKGDEIFTTFDIQSEDDFFKLNDHCVIGVLMEYFPSEDLYDYITDHNNKPLSLIDIQQIASQIGSAIDYMHQKDYMHRDIKTENILFSRATSIAKLIDFNLARKMASKDLTRCGTISYVAPEILFTDTYDGKKVDAYAFGILLYFMLFKRFPFESLFEVGLKRNFAHVSDTLDKFCKSGQPLSQFYNKNHEQDLEILKKNEVSHIMDLIDHLTNTDPEERLSIAKALNHPFFSMKYQSK